MNHRSPDKDYVTLLEKYEQTRIIFGEGAFTQMGEMFMLDGVGVAAFVTGGQHSSMESGAYKRFFNMASAFELETPIFSGIGAEPDTECVRALVKHFETYRPEVVVAAGGGSVMDAAKAAYLSYQTGIDVKSLFGSGKASALFPDRKFKRVLCAPTTAGTGSEATPYSNIVDRSENLKYIIADEAITPEYAFVDPTLTHSAGRALTCATALDALTHAIESLLNINKDVPIAEKWALESVKLIHYALPITLEHPHDALAREMLSAAATLAGMCIGAKPTALPHLCSFSMWGKVPHGLAVSLLLPHFWRYYLADAKVCEATKKLAGIFEPSTQENADPLKIVAAVEKFISSVSGIGRLSELHDFNTELIEKIASDAVKNPSKLENAPRRIPTEKAYDIISSILTKAL